VANVLIVGDGPGGLSAALFLAKKGMEVTVFGVDKSDMHRAMLYNYLGIPGIKGRNFQKIARNQVKGFGASIQDLGVTGIEKTAEGFLVATKDGGQHQGKYLILAEGKKLELAKSLDLPRTPEGVEADSVGRTSVEGLYVIGRAAGIPRSQAIISAGQGASAALDILSTEAGKHVNDYDVVPD
jgi:thioredoxin reductase (NADPH)